MPQAGLRIKGGFVFGNDGLLKQWHIVQLH
jgi:hypothetical protein